MTDAYGYFSFSNKTVKNGTNKLYVSYPGNDNFNLALSAVNFNVNS